MDFINEHLPEFIVICLITVVILFAVISFVVLSLKNYNKKRHFVKNYNAKVFTIDFKDNSILYFYKRNAIKKSKISFDDFYNLYHSNDKNRIEEWFSKIKNDKKVNEQYLEVEGINKKNNSFNLLKALKYDFINEKLYLESVQLKYISSSLGRKINKNQKHFYLVKRSKIESAFNDSKYNKGYGLSIRFFYSKRDEMVNQKVEKSMVLTLKNEIYPFANAKGYKRFIIDNYDNEVLLFDFKIDSKDEGIFLASSIENALNKAIEINGFKKSIDFSIGLAACNQFVNKFNDLLEKMQEASLIAQNSNQSIFVYQNENNSSNARDTKSIEKVFKTNKLRYLFRPIIDCYSYKIVGYFEYIKTYGYSFGDYFEMARYAAKIEKSKKLFYDIVNYSVNKFISERSNQSQKLYINVSIVDLDYIFDVFKNISNVDQANIVLLFDESEIYINNYDINLLSTHLDSLKSLGFKSSLILKDSNLLLSNSIYCKFYSFVLASSSINGIKDNNRIRISNHFLIEELLSFSRPIIATNIDSWSNILLLVKSGIKIISSEIISPNNDMFLPIEKKKIEKLKNLNKD